MAVLASGMIGKTDQRIDDARSNVGLRYLIVHLRD